MNISTSLTQCCDIALLVVIKRQAHVYSSVIDYKEVKDNIKTMIELLRSNWKFELSTQAANDLTTKKWNKVTIIPLASDLKVMKDY